MLLVTFINVVESKTKIFKIFMFVCLSVRLLSLISESAFQIENAVFTIIFWQASVNIYEFVLLQSVHKYTTYISLKYLVRQIY